MVIIRTASNKVLSYMVGQQLHALCQIGTPSSLANILY